jgi:hypothetical protein
MSVVINGSAGVTTNSGAVYDSLQRDTAKASTSGTSIDFTGIPSWVRRITIMFNGVSTNGTSFKQVQVGAGSFLTSGYVSASSTIEGSSAATGNATSGFFIRQNVAADLIYGHLVITNINGNNWISSHAIYSDSGTDYNIFGAGSTLSALSGTLDRVRITTLNGTDTFDAGTINIIYE